MLECASPSPGAENLRRLLLSQPSWGDLYTLAEEHGVVALLEERLSGEGIGAVPDEFRKRLAAGRRAQAFFTLAMMAELFPLLEQFEKAGVQPLVVKGPVLATRAFGDPGMRQYGDLDLLFRHRDIVRASECMTAAGFEPDIPSNAMSAKKTPGEYVFRRAGRNLLFELHTERTLRYFPRRLPVETFFKRSVPLPIDGKAVPALSPEDEFVLICIHNAKHFWERLMWVADVAALAMRDNLDWERAGASAKAVDAEYMVRVALRLAQRVLHARLPDGAERLLRAAPVRESFIDAIIDRLPYAGYRPLPLAGRARFRLRMRGGPIRGLPYLLRLSFSPTEEDWVEGEEEKRSSWLDALRRPLRLAKKYGSSKRN